LFAVVPPARRKKCTIKEAFTNCAWVVDIHGDLTLDIITEYIQLWDLFMVFSYSLKCMTHIIGDCPTVDSTQHNLDMKSSSWVQHCSNHVIEFGKHGHLQNAGYSYGWSHTSPAGQQIVLSSVDYLTQRNALFVIRRMKILIIS
jgi:hypothetical protein